MMRFTELPQVNSRILGKTSRSSRLAMITRIGVDHRYPLYHEQIQHSVSE